MNRIATELRRLAAEIAPLVTLTFTRGEKTEEKDLHSLHLEVQRLVSQLMENEKLETMVKRTESEGKMVLEVGFTDHAAKDAMVEKIIDVAKKGARKLDIKVKVD